MPKKLSFKEKYVRLLNKEEVEVYPINIVGIPVHFENYFMPWVIESLKKFSIDIYEISPEDLLIEILKKYDLPKEIFVFRGTSLLNARDDFVYIGKLLEDFHESSSIKRMQTEMYNCFEKMNLINYNTSDALDPKFVGLITDFIYYEGENE